MNIPPTLIVRRSLIATGNVAELPKVPKEKLLYRAFFVDFIIVNLHNMIDLILPGSRRLFLNNLIDFNV